MAADERPGVQVTQRVSHCAAAIGTQHMDGHANGPGAFGLLACSVKRGETGGFSGRGWGG